MTARTERHYPADGYRRGDRVVDRDGDVWRKGTGWWHWEKRSSDTGPGKLMWAHLVAQYGPVVDVRPEVPSE